MLPLWVLLPGRSCTQPHLHSQLLSLSLSVLFSDLWNLLSAADSHQKVHCKFPLGARCSESVPLSWVHGDSTSASALRTQRPSTQPPPRTRDVSGLLPKGRRSPGPEAAPPIIPKQWPPHLRPSLLNLSIFPRVALASSLPEQNSCPPFVLQRPHGSLHSNTRPRSSRSPMQGKLSFLWAGRGLPGSRALGEDREWAGSCF